MFFSLSDLSIVCREVIDSQLHTVAIIGLRVPMLVDGKIITHMVKGVEGVVIDGPCYCGYLYDDGMSSSLNHPSPAGSY